MAKWLIYRHGSNAANQGMCDKMAVDIVDAATAEQAVETSDVKCYANQHLTAVSEEDLTDEQIDDWNAFSESLAMGL